MIAGSINNKILLAGGENIPDLFSTVDIYSTATNSWSTASLSGARYTPSNFAYSTPIPTTVGQKIFFAGGQTCWIQDCPSNRIDIYDVAANTWSYEDYLPYVPGTYLFSGISAGNKNYWVTGDYWEGGNIVEIRDELTHFTSYECLSGVLFGHPVKSNNKLIFPISALPMSTTSYRLTHFDIYDLATNTWSINKLPAPVIYHQLINVNNEIYEIGGNVTSSGYLEDKIYKLEF
jgi:Galactose oxidase, central domain